MTNARGWLAVVLRVNGGLMILATAAVVLPHAAMDHVHRWLGLGELPDLPIVGYLTRSLSAIYAMLGAMAIFIAADLSRYLPLIRCWAVAAVLFGISMFAIDLATHMPLWWAVGEGCFVTAVGCLILWLARRGSPEA
jgi:hypothetical protein